MVVHSRQVGRSVAQSVEVTHGWTSEGFWRPVDLACPVWQDK